MRYTAAGRDPRSFKSPAPELSQETRENIHTATWWIVEAFLKANGDRPTSVQLYMWSDEARARALGWFARNDGWRGLALNELEVAHCCEGLAQASIGRNNCGIPCETRGRAALCSKPDGHDGECDSL
jgi:hypothetical protein